MMKFFFIVCNNKNIQKLLFRMDMILVLVNHTLELRFYRVKPFLVYIGGK